MLYLLWIDYSTDPGFYYKDIDYVFLVYNIVIYCIAHHTKWLHFRIGVSTHSLFSNFQVYIFDWKITHSKTWYVKIILYTCFLRVYMHVNVHTYHIHELIYHSLTGLYSIIFGQINYAIISANPLLLYKINIFIGIRFMISSLYNITYYMSILILCFPDLNNYFSILCCFSLYALYNKFLIILLLDILYLWNILCTLNYLLYASATCRCPSTYPSFTMGYRTWHQANCYITIHVAHIHAQGGRCMTISNIYSIVSISFVHHTNKINFHIIVHHSYIYDILLYIYRIADPCPISYKTLDHYSISHSKQTEDNG